MVNSIDYWINKYNELAHTSDELRAENERLQGLNQQLQELPRIPSLENFERIKAERDELKKKLIKTTGELVMDRHRKMLQRLAQLDGVAAVNLAEPSAGDLERVTAAYSVAREEIKNLKDENSYLKYRIESLELEQR